MKYPLPHFGKDSFFRGILFLLFISLVFFATYMARYKIYNIFRSFRSGPIYEDVTTWAKKPYGFQENLSKSNEFYKAGLEELIEKSLNVYSIEQGDKKLMSKRFSSEIDWKNHVNPLFLEATLTLIKDIQLLCQKPRVENSRYQEWSQNKDFNLKVNKKNRRYPVIKPKKSLQLQNWIRLLDEKYFYFAMQKKPDHYATLTIRKDILEATCQPLLTIKLWYKAIDYLEYKAEKDVYTPRIKPYILKFKKNKSLENNKKYAMILNHFFQTFFPSVQEIDSKIKLSWKNFLIQQTMKSLNHYSEAMLERCRISGPQDCRKVYNSLYKLKFKGVNSNPVYLYVLSEVAFRAKAYNIAQKLLNEFATLKVIDPSYKKQSERLLNVLENSPKI